jgi:NhaP-type Na+/H+ or K+/H+ antiporter
MVDYDLIIVLVLLMALAMSIPVRLFNPLRKSPYLTQSLVGMRPVFHPWKSYLHIKR